MNKSEWMKVGAFMQSIWPHSQLTPEALQVQFEFVGAIPYDVAVVAVKAIALTGKEHAPNGAQIARWVLDSATNLPTWGDAYGEIRKWVDLGPRSYSPGSGSRLKRPEPWQWSHPLITAFVDKWGHATLEHDIRDGTARAQMRDVFNALRDRTERGDIMALASGERAAVDRGGRPGQIGDAVRQIAENIRQPS